MLHILPYRTQGLLSHSPRQGIIKEKGQDHKWALHEGSPHPDALQVIYDELIHVYCISEIFLMKEPMEMKVKQMLYSKG